MVVDGTASEVKIVGSSPEHIVCPLPIEFVPLKELTRIVMVKELKQGEAIEDVACTRTVEVSDNVPEGTNKVEAADEGPWLMPLIKY